MNIFSKEDPKEKAIQDAAHASIVVALGGTNNYNHTPKEFQADLHVYAVGELEKKAENQPTLVEQINDQLAAHRTPVTEEVINFITNIRDHALYTLKNPADYARRDLQDHEKKKKYPEFVRKYAQEARDDVKGARIQFAAINADKSNAEIFVEYFPNVKSSPKQIGAVVESLRTGKLDNSAAVAAGANFSDIKSAKEKLRTALEQLETGVSSKPVVPEKEIAGGDIIAEKVQRSPDFGIVG